MKILNSINVLAGVSGGRFALLKSLKVFQPSWLLSIVLILALMIPLSAVAQPFRYLMITDGRVSATNSDINFYNTFVQGDADGGTALPADAVGLTWKAIASTTAVDALTNIGGPSGVEIRLLDGTFAASSTADLFDGDGPCGAAACTFITPDDLTAAQAHPPTVVPGVWTGSNFAGSQAALVLGNVVSVGARAGLYTEALSGWVDEINFVKTGARPLYALSDVIGAPAPDPALLSNLPLSLLAAGLLFWVARRRRCSN